MKKRTEEKREAILDAATAVFRELGFHNASMNAIAARLGGSKMTLQLLSFQGSDFSGSYPSCFPGQE